MISRAFPIRLAMRLTTCLAVCLCGTALANGADSLSLDQALGSAFAKHPGLEANRRAIAAREARVSQASRGANPELSLEVEDFGGTGRSQGLSAAQTTLQISRTLELGGKRGRRENLARAEKSLAESGLEAKRMEIHSLVCRHFMDALYAQRRLALAQEAKALSERLLQAVARRVSEGAASSADEIRARLAVSEAAMEVRQDTSRLEAAKRKLALLWGEEASIPSLRDGLDSLPEIPPLARLYAEMETGPAASAKTLNVKWAQAKLDQQQGLYGPDLTVSAGVRHMNEAGDFALVGGIAMPLPFRNRGQGHREEARQELGQAQAERDEGLLDLKALASGIHAELALAREEIASLSENLIPDAVKAATVLADGYRKGRFGMLEVLNAEKDLFQFRIRHLESLLRFRQGHAELERLIGPVDLSIPHGKGD